MKWHSNLYIGESASLKEDLVKRLKAGERPISVRLITLPSNQQNMLDIIPCISGFYNEQLYVVGVAQGEREACKVVQAIIRDVYTATGGFDIMTYFKCEL